MLYSLIPGTALPSSLFMYIVELMGWARPLFQSPPSGFSVIFIQTSLSARCLTKYEY